MMNQSAVTGQADGKSTLLCHLTIMPLNQHIEKKEHSKHNVFCAR